jgi:hypothetical protein
MKWIVLLLIIAGVAGYFTKPEEAAMQQAADAELNFVEGGLSTLGVGERQYSNYYVVSRYVVDVADTRVTCWGAFGQVKCSRR